MKPLNLEFQGIKSYTKKTEIDFLKLLDNGIFGIFGNTGSGKSTILDCILLALYGRLPKTREATDFINLSMQSGYVKFSFSMIEEGVNNIYEVRREFKLKLPRKAGTHKATLLKRVGDELIPIAETVEQVLAKIKEIIGLEMEDFEKCIILPQGEFSAFVSLQRAKRLEMMSSLFNLEKYGVNLIGELKRRLGEQGGEINAEERLLTAYVDATKENLEETKNKLSSLESEKITQDIKNLKIKDSYSKYKENYDRRKKLDSLNETLEIMQKQQNEITLKKAYASKYYLAENARKLKKEYLNFLFLEGQADENLLKEKKLQTLCLDRVKELNKDKEQFAIKKSKLIELYELNARLVAIKNDISEISEKDKKVDGLRKRFIENKAEFEKLNKAKQAVIDNVNLLSDEEKTANVKDGLFGLLRKMQLCLDGSFVKEELNFLNEISNEVSGKVFEKIKERIAFLSQKIDGENNFDFNSVISEIDTLSKVSEKFSKRREALNLELGEFDKKLIVIENEKQKINDEGISLKAETDKLKQKVDCVLKGENYDKLVLSVSSEIDAIGKCEETLSKRENQLNKEVGEINEKIALLNASKLSNGQLAKSKQEELEKLVLENFESFSEVETVLTKITNLEAVKTEIQTFENKKYSLKESINELKNQISNEECSEEGFLQIKSQFDESEIYIKELNKNIDYLKKDYENLSHKFEERCIIENKVNKIRKEYELNSRLMEVVRSNGLVEFVADEYLKEIASSAKNTLLTLTDGRLGLDYSGEFFIEDNVLGGDKRKVDTVSGGELFLVSLSLALALSKSIYAKSQRPIEFFFLDEGFGSLDKDLVETVMDSLNKLKDSELTVGVISHVESLKERISSKICVQPATETAGSTLTLTF